ncbi:GNAT family N-acetyltransferase [Halorientalis marina]|jgi:GNAT superfamily N-acetyltransferase|uniref:GNAT family N-acetyltransferase n=1 Tax=Halorientalis marina TaxID=2931976 RepID=UPI001FF352EB|nr:helix-turn-helix domain-containing GNAT family N-acetyltransferase [Halorientalis marina]
MSPLSTLDIETDDRRRIYRYVERRGAVPPGDVAEAVEIDPETFRHHVAVLKRDGLLREVDGTLRVQLDCGEAEEHETGGLQYEIRPARQEDTSGVLGVIRAVADAERDLVAESVAEQLDYEQALTRHNAAETRLFFVGAVAGEVVGFCHLDVPRMAKLAGAAELTVGVLEEYRRYSIGSHLLQRGMSWARSQGCRRVYNSIPETNDLALSFLQDNGWRVEAVRSRHFLIDDEPVDELQLAADL